MTHGEKELWDDNAGWRAIEDELKRKLGLGDDVTVAYEAEPVQVFTRQLPVASDRDRIATARYAAEKLAHHMSVICRRKRLLWVSYVSSDGGIVSVNV